MSASTPQRNGNNDTYSSVLRKKPMSEKTWERNTTGLATYTQQRKEQKYQQAEAAISTLLREHKAVNFTSVAKAAQVTKAYLYSQPLLRDRIEALRQRELKEKVWERTT